MDKKSNKASAPVSEPQAVEVDNVDKIRDILFGQQMREVSEKFASLENNLAKDLAAMRQENSQQLDSLKSFLESEIAILSSNLGNEEKTRIEQLDELDDKLKQNVKQIDKKFSETQKSLDAGSSEFNQKILKQSQDFSADLTKKMVEARERMDGHHQELGKNKVDKLTLSEVLTTLAMQINPDDSKQ